MSEVPSSKRWSWRLFFSSQLVVVLAVILIAAVGYSVFQYESHWKPTEVICTVTTIQVSNETSYQNYIVGCSQGFYQPLDTRGAPLQISVGHTYRFSLGNADCAACAYEVDSITELHP